MEADDKMEVENTIIAVDEVKKEPVEVADYVDEAMIIETINANAHVKSDPDSGDSSSDDDTMLADRLRVSASKGSEVAGESSDNLLDDKVSIQETYIIKSELPKEERILYCETCGAEFEGYCMKCPMISHILDNTNVATDGSSPHDTIPRDVLQFKDSTPDLGVSAVKAIPKDITFGPFDGLESVSSTTGWAWKLRDGKPIPSKENFKSSNWMQYINCAEDITERNLDVFQCEDRLYYRSVSDISESEELLVHFGEENLTSVDSDTDKYFNPVVEKSTGNIYACSFCCLGFKTEAHLIKHKTVCPYRRTENMTTEGIVQCTFCKIWLEEKELSENHVNRCCDKYARPVPLEVKKFKCYVCCKSYESLLVQHQTTQGRHQPFNCEECSLETKRKRILQYRLCMQRPTHSNTKLFERKTSCFKTKRNAKLNQHLPTHCGATPFECEKCSYKANRQANLNRHLLTHSSAKPFECEKCSYKTNCMAHLNRHLLTHSSAKPFECDICPYNAKRKDQLNQHLLTHSGAKPFECKKCSYKARRKANMNRHLLTHSSE